ncbi:MAG TPA: type II toxin-antitoxin system CcdA family antitoxin [Acetobacteraceae bacterium]|nr:type II toxin-antitoxin system CcdA family antitoxin [Acetobacteraceae bacterium]
MPKLTASGSQQISAPRRATNITLSEGLLREARELEINVSQACERGLAAEVAQTRAQRWLRENRAAMDAWNDYVERHGLPLAEFRQF